jgi:penicillin-binding protein 1A
MANLNDKQKKQLKTFWIIFLSPVALLFVLFFAISMGWLGYMPDLAALENPTRDLASEVYSEDGKVLGTFYWDENRNNVEYKNLSPWLVKALIAREDHRFQKHSGIDGMGLLRVVGKTILMGNTSQGGGSTITQQLAKNLFQRDTSGYRFKVVQKTLLAFSKFREWVIAVKLERNYSKEEIVTMYFNTVSFSSDAYGIKSASREYFGKAPDSLKLEEAAMLVAMLKANTRYNPVRNPERALQRRNDVIDKMYEHDYISKLQRDSFSAIPINKTLKYQAQSHDAGLATYLRAYIQKMMIRSKPDRDDYRNYKSYKDDSLRWITDPLYGWCNKNVKPDGSKYNLYKDGLKIYTTINSRMQEYAERSLREHLAKTVQPNFFAEKRKKWNLKKAPYSNKFSEDKITEFLTSAMHQTERYRKMKTAGSSEREILDNFRNNPVDMRVFSWRGDIDTTMTPWDSIRYFKFFLRASFIAMDPHTGFVKAYVGGPDFRYFKYDGVIDQKRQVGSTIKPFIYTLAMQEGMSPCTKALNSPIGFHVQDTIWQTKNSEPTEYDGKMVPLWWGLANSVNNISGFLVNTFNPQPVADLIHRMGVKSDIPAVPSICEGTPEMSLYELVGAYTTFPNKGVYTQPIMVTSIEDKNGNLLTTIKPQKSEAISENTAYTMLKMLERVVLSGTGARLRYTYKLMNPIGGKTGTTNDNSDGWFVGVTPDLIGGAWVGGEEYAIRFDNMTYGQGAAVALPIFGGFMQKVYADPKINLNKGPFVRPASGFEPSFNCDVKGNDSKENNDAW